MAKLIFKKWTVFFFLALFCGTGFAENSSAVVAIRGTEASLFTPFGKTLRQAVDADHVKNASIRERNDQSLKNILSSLKLHRPQFFRMVAKNSDGSELETIAIPEEKILKIQKILLLVKDLRVLGIKNRAGLEREIHPFLAEFETTLESGSALNFSSYDQFMRELSYRSPVGDAGQASQARRVLTQLRDPLADLNVSIPQPAPETARAKPGNDPSTNQ